jgi:hypothetical protein
LDGVGQVGGDETQYVAYLALVVWVDFVGLCGSYWVDVARNYCYFIVVGLPRGRGQRAMVSKQLGCFYSCASSVGLYPDSALAYAAEQPEAEGCLKQSKPRRESKMPEIIS